MLTHPEQLVSRLNVEDVVVRMFVATDERDWATLQGCFTNPFTLDMSSMVGGEPASMTPTQVVQAWATGFEPLDHVHHQVGNFRTEVTGKQARLKCHGIAYHYRAKAKGGKSRVFVGSYDIELKAVRHLWKISRLTFKLKFIDGNLELERS